MRFYTIFPLLLFGLLSPVWYPAQLDVTGQLLITELYYDTPGDDGQEEWIEITNVGTAVILLSDIRIGDEESSGGREGMKRFPEGAQIGPEQSLIIAQTAVGFRALFGFNPHFEMIDSDSTVPNMRNSRLWATGDVALANDGDEVLLLQDAAILDAVNYGDSTHYFAPSVAGVFRGQSIERVPANCDSNTAADWQPARVPTPGTVQLDAQCTVVMAAELETLPTIGDIQGTTDISPMVNEIVSFRGVVTGWLEDRNANGITFYTLFVQDVPGTEDGDPATSDGIALFLGRKRPSYQIGDQLRITGQVTEFFGYTEIDDDNLEILVEGGQSPLPEPVIWDWSDATLTELESWESMLVAVPDAAAVVGATFSSCALIAAENADRLFQRNEQAPTGLVLPIIHTSDVDCTGFPQLKTGDRISNIRGPLIYQFDQFKVVQQEPAALHIDQAAWPERPLPLIPTANQISAATLNLENYFDAVDNTGTLAEPKPSEDDIASRQAKFVHLIGNLLGCPTLLGVQEVENEPLLATLAEALTQPCGFRYTISHLDSPDARGIDVALLSDPRRVSVGAMRLQQVCTTINTGIVDSTIDCPTG
ncbi:MAG: lamin tail domain-containing protein, partial [Anaerolineales bacterium]|nr:lamin tail domain-containing protein [Anaerolineales bacterium]